MSLIMEKMKKFRCLLLALCAVLLLTACDSGGGGSDDDDDIVVDPFPSIAVEPYLPDEFAGLTGALYKSDLEIEEETISGVTYVIKELTSVYVFDNLSFVSSSTKIYINKSTGVKDDSKTERKPEAKGTYTKTGDYDNGTFNVSKTHDWEDDPVPGHWESDPENKSIKVTNGSFTLSESGYSIKFTKSS